MVYVRAMTNVLSIRQMRLNMPREIKNLIDSFIVPKDIIIFGFSRLSRCLTNISPGSCKTIQTTLVKEISEPQYKFIN